MSALTTSPSRGLGSVPLKDENGNEIRLEDASASDLKREQERLNSEFIAAGKAVSELVNRRTELYRILDSQKEKLLRLRVTEGESGLDDIDDNDPLYFIESEYPFFEDAELCTPENIGNVEDPRKCIAAMEAFVKVIQENDHRFKHLPKGPLYQQLRVKNKKWATLVEYVLRPHLFTFMVDNIVDGLVMQELIEEHFPSTRLFAGGSVNEHGVVRPKYHLFPFNSETPAESRITAMTGLELENMIESIYSEDEDWSNFLSKTINVEKIIFMDNENAAFLVMSHIRSTPWHCKMAYTLDGFCVHPFPNFRTKKIRIHPRPIYLKCVPNVDILDNLILVNITEHKIEVVNKEIGEKRVAQMNLLREVEKMSRIYAKAEAREVKEAPTFVKSPKHKKKTVKPKRSEKRRLLF